MGATADPIHHTALGLMSGTSLDGIDVAVIATDGKTQVMPLGFLSRDYDTAFRRRLRGLLGGQAPADQVAAVERELTLLHAAAVRDLLAEAGMTPSQMAVIGFHGHTILHEPQVGRTWQIGDGALLARETGIDVVARSARQRHAPGRGGRALGAALSPGPGGRA